MQLTTITINKSQRFTFQTAKIKSWVEKCCVGKVLNLFAGKTKLDVDEVRVDVDSGMNADYYMDAKKFILKSDQRNKYDTIIIDTNSNELLDVVNGIGAVAKQNHRVIMCGDCMGGEGMGVKRGYTVFAKLAVRFKDRETYCLVETKD